MTLAGGCGGGGSEPGVDRAPGKRSIPLDQKLTRALESTLDDRREVHELPGLAAAVALPGGDVWSGASGVADLRTRRPLTGRTPFAIASLTKTFVAALVLKLAEEGRLRLDDPISRWVPRFPNAAGITVRQLLNHTSGLSGVDENDAYNRALSVRPESHWTPARTLRYVPPSRSKPGEGLNYSDTNYVLLGLVIERATGSTVAAELRRRLLDPLDLHNVWLQPDERPSVRPARAYNGIDRNDRPRVVSGDSGYVPYRSIASSKWTAAGMVADAESVARFGAALFGGQVLQPASLKQMLRFVSAEVAVLDGYGLGVGRWHSSTLSDRELWANIGLTDGHVSALVHSPRDGITVAMVNNDTTVPAFADIVEGLLETVLDHRRPAG